MQITSGDDGAEFTGSTSAGWPLSAIKESSVMRESSVAVVDDVLNATVVGNDQVGGEVSVPLGAYAQTYN